MSDNTSDNNSKPVTIKQKVSDDEKMDSNECEEQQLQQKPPSKKRKYESKSKLTTSTTTATKPKKEKKISMKRQAKTNTTAMSNDAPPKERAKSNPWTLEEDRKLFEAVARDVNWGQIAKEDFPNRNRQACRARWLTLIKRIERTSTVIESEAKDKTSDE
ncbi:992_t:CDS:2 [Ambispora leptoticha]|uniref:992_t:CDS:1 n=1 Tax=Ambispora leptoticha TaxID=144679 RepID=A0A9N9C3T6_9GLOM|nr:992_t:CDS:2 [Ambispora leptoticha]